ncbi:MAG: type II toxin-antitoxin system Phd/YefM family antitoxin [Fidelibacterota bacterium]
MKTVNFTEFRKKASGLITEVEHGESIVLIRHGKPVAEVTPYTRSIQSRPSWKEPGIRLQIQGGELSASILDERKTGR